MTIDLPGVLKFVLKLQWVLLKKTEVLSHYILKLYIHIVWFVITEYILWF